MNQHETYQAKRHSLLQRLAKLRQMTCENGCTESEAAIAAQKIAAICAELQMSETEATIKANAGRCRLAIFNHDAETIAWTSALNGVKRLFNVKIWNSHEYIQIGKLQKKIRVIRILGLPDDVDAALALTEIIYCAIITSTIQWLSQANSKRHVNDFQFGMATRLNQRVVELMPVVNKVQALVVLKHQIIEEEFETLGYKLHSSRKTITNPFAFAAGTRAADNIALKQHAEVGQTLRLK